MPLQETSGAASYDAYGGGVAAVPNYIEDVFSTYLYTGNGSTQTITNGIDLAGKGGLVWIKSRTNTSGGETAHALVDTARGSSKWLSTDATSAQATNANLVTGFTSSGFSVGTAPYWANENGIPYASWTFRKAPKFFDVVTYTGNSSTQNIAHNLGSVPGCMIVKRTDSASDWWVYHRSLTNAQYLRLNLTNAVGSSSAIWDSTTPTSTQFTLGASTANASGGTYVAYLFAHNAGGFGLTGTDNVISCGSFTTDGSGNATVSLGYEPQWVLMKNASGTSAWVMLDNMRGWSMSNDAWLSADTSAAENSAYNFGNPTATGFDASFLASGATYIYIAIRRGPMKTPTSGTSVYTSTTSNGSTFPNFTSNFVVDAALTRRPSQIRDNSFGSRLQGAVEMYTNLTSAEVAAAEKTYDSNVGFGNGYTLTDTRAWMFRRAPGFFDEVCYKGTGSNTTQAHNLGVVPELMIVKRRDDSVYAGRVYHKDLGANYWLYLFYSGGDAAVQGPNSYVWNGAPTSTYFNLGNDNGVNASGSAIIAYLFATCAGVSKVGNYTGTGTTKQVDCGFAAGARFVLIKRTDSTGNWGVLDTARGMVSGTDPYLNLNTTAAEVNANNVYTATGGFQLVSSDANFNASGGSYIFLAVA